MDVEIKVSGIREVNKALYSYSQQLGDKVVIASLLQGARLVQRSVKIAAPVRTGMLKRGIVVKRSKIYSPRRGGNKLGVYLTLRKGRGRKDPRDVFYGKFMDGGWTDRGGNKHQGSGFITGTFNRMKGAAVRLIVASAERGAEIVKRRTGLR